MAKEVATLVTAIFNGHSMVGSLQRVLVCSPESAGWHKAEVAAHWRDLGFLHPPDFEVAQSQHDALRRQLEGAGAEVICLPGSETFSLDALYAHDSSLATDFGMILMNPGKATRSGEPAQHRQTFDRLAIPVLGAVEAPGTAEAGDMLWLHANTLLIGRGFRTNAAGIEQVRRLLEPKGIEVIAAPLPHGPGPSACLHLMSLISLLDENTALVDLPWLAVETVELLRGRGYGFIDIDPSERETLACNVLALGGKRLLCLEENSKTNKRLRQTGFEVRTFPGSELCVNGSGGPTYLTRPLLRH